MAWTTPRTWIPGEKVTADMLNVQLRDNLNELSLASIVTSAPTTAIGTQNNFDPGIVGNTIIRVNSAAALTVTGLSAGVAGQRVRIINIGAFPVFLSPENAGSTTTGRLWNFVTSGPTPIGPAVAGSAGVPGTQGFAEYVYDLTSSRWRLVAHEQGSWITPTFNASDFTADVNTWTVEAADVDTMKYWLKGRTLFVTFYLQNTTVSGGTVNYKRIGNAQWGGFSVGAAAGIHEFPYRVNNAGAGYNMSGLINISESDVTRIRLYSTGAAAVWNTGTNNHFDAGNVYFEVA